MEKNKDLGIKVLPEEEAFWTNIKKNFETELKVIKNSLKFQTAVLEMINSKIEKEKGKV